MDGTIESLCEIARGIAKNGVTGFLPTTMSMERKKVIQALNAVRSGMKCESPGAHILGAHMEGPFISIARKGAHSKEFILKPDWELIEQYKNVIKNHNDGTGRRCWLHVYEACPAELGTSYSRWDIRTLITKPQWKQYISE